MATAKFRPVLSLQEIQYLVDLMQLDTASATEFIRESAASKLKIFLLKAKVGLVSSAYSAMERVDIADQLDSSPATRRQQAYELWKRNPALCTPEQLAAAATYRYESGLMTTAEEEEYENL